MHNVTDIKISAEAVSAVAAARNILIVNTLGVVCGLALVVFVCMATNGLDMSAGFF
jgi:hypothetical protein